MISSLVPCSLTPWLGPTPVSLWLTYLDGDIYIYIYGNLLSYPYCKSIIGSIFQALMLGHSEKNSWKIKQGEKATFRMGENNSKRNNWQRINLQNIQGVHAAQYQKRTTQSKSGQKNETHISAKKTYRWLINTWKCPRHHSLSEKCKTTRGHHLTPVRMAAIKKSTNNNCWRGCKEKREPCYTVGGNANWHNHYGELCGDSLKNWK